MVAGSLWLVKDLVEIINEFAFKGKPILLKQCLWIKEMDQSRQYLRSVPRDTCLMLKRLNKFFRVEVKMVRLFCRVSHKRIDEIVKIGFKVDIDSQ
jgi:hypothetical protein